VSTLDFLAQLVGQKIAGGCDDCDAYQTVEQDPQCSYLWTLHVHHDDTCPFYVSLLNRRQRRAKRGRK
jgi:hypothetical protein